jgi:hypothetical protein
LIVPAAALNSALNLLSGAVALFVSYYAYKTNRLLSNNLLRYISLGFMLLGFGLMVEAFTQVVVGVTPVGAVALRGLEYTEFLIYITLQLVAYVVFAFGYGRSTFRESTEQLAVIPLLASAVRRPSPILPLAAISLGLYLSTQLGIIVLLAFVVFQGLLIFSRSKSDLALVVLFGFMLIFLSHIVSFAAVFAGSELVYLIGNLMQFCGFLGLLFFLLWSSRYGAT